MLGDVAAGNGDPSLAVFGDGCAAGGTPVTPHVHTLVQLFPLFDNLYDPSRRSADSHQWISNGMAPYDDDIQSPDWIRSYPGGNSGDALIYLPKGSPFSEAALPVKMYAPHPKARVCAERSYCGPRQRGVSKTICGVWALVRGIHFRVKNLLP